jgi:Cu2+-containing amine oxidase
MNRFTKNWSAMERKDPLNEFTATTLNHLLEVIKRSVSFQEHEPVELIYH